jgi:hypothetical protein
LDEIGSRYAFEIQLAVADAFWNLADFPKPFYLWMANIRGFLHFPPVSAPLLAAVGNSSGGQGVMLMETYMLSTPDQESYDRQLTALNDHLYWADRCIPGGRSRIGFMISGYTNNGVFNTWIHPETDYKCVVERFCRKLAVDPELTGFYAMGAYAMNRFDEELARWTAAVFRHYAIEGNTDSLAERYGFKFNPGFLQNGDFDNKTEGWTVEPAGEGSLKHFYQANFGKKPMGRQRNSGKHGDHAMLFVRSDKKPNKLSQRITGLTPGKKYSLLFVTADPDNVKKPGNELLKVVFNADISDSRTVADGSYQLVQPGPVATRYKRNENGEAVIDKIIPMPQIVTHKIVFVPEKPEVTITFSDWQDEKTPGGKIGEKRVINFISVNPFFED